MKQTEAQNLVMTESIKEILTQKEVCRLLDVTRHTLARWKAAGLITSHTMKGKVYYLKSEIINNLKNK